MKSLARSFAIALLLPAGSLFAQTTQPTTQPTPVTATQLQDLQTHLSVVKTVQADFTQTKKLAMLKHDLVIHGRFAFEKPSHIAWITDSPSKSAVTLEGDHVQQWDEVTNQVQTADLSGDPTFKAVSAQLQSWFTGNYAAMEGQYDVTQLSQTPLVLRFAPHTNTQMTQFITAVEVTFDASNGYIQRIKIDEKSGSVTDLTFINSIVNEPVPASIWKVPPHGK